MSLVGLVMFRNWAMNTRLNSAANIMNANQALTNAAGNSNLSFGSAHALDKKLMADKATNGLLYKASCAMEESAKKQLDKEIKRSFSIFA